MEKRVEETLLLDFYAPLLTERQRETARLYYGEDLTLAEVAGQLGVSRQAAHDALKCANARLEKYERALGLVARYAAIRKEAAACGALLSNVTPAPGSENALSEAKRALARLCEWEMTR